MKFLIFLISLSLALPVFAQQPPVPLPDVAVTPLQSINSDIRADGNIYRFYLTVK